jgi:hypothetical protein
MILNDDDEDEDDDDVHDDQYPIQNALDDDEEAY